MISRLQTVAEVIGVSHAIARATTSGTITPGAGRHADHTFVDTPFQTDVPALWQMVKCHKVHPVRLEPKTSKDSPFRHRSREYD
jgi:hypothetical protein